MRFELTEVFEALIALAVALVTYVLVPLIKAKLTDVQFNALKKWVKIAVECAEQIFKETGKGKEKKAYVVEFLKSKGIEYTEEELDALIESAVLELKKD